MSEKRYLGDSVYVAFDGYHLVLTTENDDRGPSNTIYVEPAVYAALEHFVSGLRQGAANALDADAVDAGAQNPLADVRQIEGQL